MAFFYSTNNHRIQVDDERLNYITQWSWHYSDKTGAQRTDYANLQRTVRLHRQLTNAPKGMSVDHINGDTSDNRLENLRVCTHSDNSKNRKLNKNSSSGFKGVHKHNGGRWHARITANGKRISLGTFDSPIEASLAYESAARKLHGNFKRELVAGRIAS